MKRYYVRNDDIVQKLVTHCSSQLYAKKICFYLFCSCMLFARSTTHMANCERYVGSSAQHMHARWRAKVPQYHIIYTVYAYFMRQVMGHVTYTYKIQMMGLWFGACVLAQPSLLVICMITLLFHIYVYVYLDVR